MDLFRGGKFSETRIIGESVLDSIGGGQGANVFNAEITTLKGENKLVLIEQCDNFFGVALDKAEALRLITELATLVDKL